MNKESVSVTIQVTNLDELKKLIDNATQAVDQLKHWEPKVKSTNV